MPSTNERNKMPNWVFNGLTVEGNPDSVKTMMAQLNKPFKQMHDSWNPANHQMEKKVTLYSEPIFAFHNIYNYADAGITEETYLGQPDIPFLFRSKCNSKQMTGIHLMFVSGEPSGT